MDLGHGRDRRRVHGVSRLVDCTLSRFSRLCESLDYISGCLGPCGKSEKTLECRRKNTVIKTRELRQPFPTDPLIQPQRCRPPKLLVLILAQPIREHPIPPCRARLLTLISHSRSCVGVWQNDRVEIIANDQGNRTTPSYVSFSESERLIGDAAKNQVAVNPHNTYVHPSVQSYQNIIVLTLSHIC